MQQEFLNIFCVVFLIISIYGFNFKKEKDYHLSIVIIQALKFQHFTVTKRGFRILKIGSAKEGS